MGKMDGKDVVPHEMYVICLLLDLVDALDADAMVVSYVAVPFLSRQLVQKNSSADSS